MKKRYVVSVVSQDDKSIFNDIVIVSGEDISEEKAKSEAIGGLSINLIGRFLSCVVAAEIDKAEA